MNTEQKVAFLEEYIVEKDKNLIDADLNYQMWTSIIMKESNVSDDLQILQRKYKKAKESLEIIIRQARGMLAEVKNAAKTEKS